MDQPARELLRALRGGVSQVALSRRLGFRSNAVAGWEGGHRFPTLCETLRVAGLRGVDTRAAAERFHPRTAEAFDPDRPEGWLRALKGAATVRDVATRAGFSEHQVGRWLRGDAEPRLPDALRLLDALTGRASDWVAALVDIALVPSLAEAHTARRRVRRLVYEAPWTSGVLTLLGVLQPHPDPAPEIARRLGLDEPPVRAVLEALVAAGVAARTDRGLRIVAPLTVDTRPTDEDVRALTAYWSGVSHARVLAPTGGERFHHNVFNLARADLPKVLELHAATYRELRAIVAASEPPELTLLFAAHLVPLSEDDPTRSR